MNQLRKLLLPALVALLLVVPASAGATSFETHSNPEQGHLTLDIHSLGGGYYRWDQLHYRLHSCHPGGPLTTDCHWDLYGRVSPSYVECPTHETFHPSYFVSTFFRHIGYGDTPLSTGRGHVALPMGWGSTHRQVVCWYVEVLPRPTFTLTAQTVIIH